MNDKGEYKFDYVTPTGSPTMTTEPEKPLSEVEKAQASVNEWKAKVEHCILQLHFARKNVKLHEWALKMLKQIEK